MKIKSLIILLILLTLNSLGQSNTRFSKEVVLTDLNILRESLEDAHFNVYTYTTEQAFDSAYKEAKKSIGKVFVLVNRQSHSQAAVTAAQIQDYDFGIVVGEETGDYPSLYASQFQYLLPNTGIPVKVSKGYIVRVNGTTEKHGVIPDIFIKDHLLDEKDEILNGLIKKIDKEY